MVFYTIAFVGYDGSGKTTIINHLAGVVKAQTIHHNKLSRIVYRPHPPKIWALLTLGEITLRNKWLNYASHISPLILDRCYICALVYSNIEGNTSIMHRIKKIAFRPDVVCLLEPAEETHHAANKYIVEYQKVLFAEGYVCFDTKPYPFGMMSFWKCPEIYYSPLLEGYIEMIGALVWLPPSNL